MITVTITGTAEEVAKFLNMRGPLFDLKELPKIGPPGDVVPLNCGQKTAPYYCGSQIPKHPFPSQQIWCTGTSAAYTQQEGQ